jgi:hypothetical protein
MLERAQHLYDLTLRQHGEMLARHDAHMARLDQGFDRLVQVAIDVAATNDRLEEQLRRSTAQHAAWMATMETYLAHQAAINERLEHLMRAVFRDRPNGRDA